MAFLHTSYYTFGLIFLGRCFMGISSIAFLSLAGSSAALMAGLVLHRTPYGHVQANRVLMALMLCLSLVLMQRFLSVVGVVYEYPHLQGLAGPLNFLIGPLLFIYLRLMSQPDYLLSRRDAYHLIPAAVSLVAYLPVYFGTSDHKKQFVENYLAETQSSQVISSIVERGEYWTGLSLIHVSQTLAFAVVMAVYAIASVRMLAKHQQTLIDNFSETDRLTLSWLRVLAWLGLLMGVASFLSVLLAPYGHNLIQAQLIHVAVLVVMAFYGGYSGICQPLIFSQQDAVIEVEEPTLEDTSATPSPKSSPKYENSGLSEDGQKLFWQQLEDYMHDERPYLIGGLTIAQLAEALDMPVAYLSQTINAEAGVSFFDYINRARVEEARQQLQALEGKSKLSTLYLDVGFNSKSTFYSQFKKHNDGLTPSEYISKQSA